MRSRLSFKAGLVGVSLVVATACGGTSGPEAACEQMVDAICARGETCNMAGASQCHDLFDQAFDCGRVVAVRDEAEFDQCLVKIDDFPCDNIEQRLAAGDIPSECKGQLLVKQ